MYYGGLEPQVTRQQSPAKSIDHALRSQVKDLERRLNRVEMVNQALWELIRDAAKLGPDDLESRIKEIDLRDGIEDERISIIPLRCPSCKRVSSSKHWKCMYCGQEFERGNY